MKWISLFSSAAAAGLMVACASTSKPAAPKAPEVPKDPDRVECRSGEDVRLLEVERKPVGCALYYSKSGRRDRVAASNMGPQECTNALKDVRKNLVTSGYVCGEMDAKPASPEAPE